MEVAKVKHPEQVDPHLPISLVAIIRELRPECSSLIGAWLHPQDLFKDAGEGYLQSGIHLPHRRRQLLPVARESKDDLGCIAIFAQRDLWRPALPEQVTNVLPARPGNPQRHARLLLPLRWITL